MKIFVLLFSLLTIEITAQWECITADFTPNPIKYIKVYSLDRVISVSKKGEVFLSEDSLKTWKKVFDNPRFHFDGMFFLSGLKAWYLAQDINIGENYEKYYTEDGGLTWVLKDFGGDMILHDIHFYNDTLGYAVFMRDIHFSS